MSGAAAELHNLALHLADGDVDAARGLLAEAEAELAMVAAGCESCLAGRRPAGEGDDDDDRPA